MILIRYFFLFITGLAGGFIVGGGVFAFITMIGIFPRLADRTNTAKYIKLYESGIIWGGSLGNLVIIFPLYLPLGNIFLALIGVFSGIFVGCLAMALAEVLKVIPIFAERVKLKYGMGWVLFSIALGKGLASLYQLW